jgi:hypothetical protein
MLTSAFLKPLYWQRSDIQKLSTITDFQQVVLNNPFAS